VSVLLAPYPGLPANPGPPNNTETKTLTHNALHSPVSRARWPGANDIGLALKANFVLKSLCLDCNPLGDEGIAALADGLRWNGYLEKLHVQYCGIGCYMPYYVNNALPSLLRIMLLCNYLIAYFWWDRLLRGRGAGAGRDNE